MRTNAWLERLISACAERVRGAQPVYDGVFGGWVLLDTWSQLICDRETESGPYVFQTAEEAYAFLRGWKAAVDEARV
jgi:hypothetical protein